MDGKGGIELTTLQAVPRDAAVDLLAFITFGDPGKDSLFKALDAALGGVLAYAAKSELFDGKSGQSLSVHTHGQIPAKRVLVIGAGARSEFKNPHLRDLAATAAQAANKVGANRVGFVVPTLGAARELAVLQHAAEGVVLGTYKFGRYLTGEEIGKSVV